jgi:DNA-binding PucR family transcriptional regulator
VRYRIARLREALGVDLDDPTVRLALALLTRVDRSR